MQLTYPVPGAPDVAIRTKKLLEDAGFGPVSEDHGRGLDHSAWVPLMLMYPEANIPVCQLSVQTDRDGAYYYDLGKALAPLRDDGVLIVGSGSATHNLRRILRTFAPTSDEPVPEWVAEFDAWLRESLLNGRHDDVKRYEERAPFAKVAHPRQTTSTSCTSRSVQPGRRPRRSSSTAAGPTPRSPTRPTGSPPSRKIH